MTPKILAGTVMTPMILDISVMIEWMLDNNSITSGPLHNCDMFLLVVNKQQQHDFRRV